MNLWRAIIVFFLSSSPFPLPSTQRVLKSVCGVTLGPLLYLNDPQPGATLVPTGEMAVGGGEVWISAVIWGETGSLSSKNNQSPSSSVKTPSSWDRDEEGTDIYYIYFINKESDTAKIQKICSIRSFLWHKYSQHSWFQTN